MQSLVIIETRGGVTEVTDYTDGVEVVHIDWDDIGDSTPAAASGYVGELIRALRPHRNTFTYNNSISSLLLQLREVWSAEAAMEDALLSVLEWVDATTSDRMLPVEFFDAAGLIGYEPRRKERQCPTE